MFYLNYNKDIKSIKSNINATAGYGYYDYLTTNYNYPGLYANGDTDLSSKVTFPIDKPRYTLLSYYGRLIYTFDNKYVLSGSYRTDGSSRFSPSNRWGVFPTVAFGWKAKQEKFLANVKAISDLKVRLSYGVTGQQAGIGLYNYLPNYSLGSNASLYQIGNTFYHVYAPVAYNASLKWEQTATYNLGIDYGFLNNRINGTLDFYSKTTSDLLNEINVVPGTNFTNRMVANIGTMDLNGVEFAINAVPVKTKNFVWNVGFNLAYNYRQVTKLTVNPDSTYIGNQSAGVNGTGNYIQITSVGYEPNQFYAYQQVYDKITGKPIEGAFVDQNGDGKIGTPDFHRYKSPFPKFVLGFNTSFSYQKWTLSTALHGNIGNYVYNQVRSNDVRDLVVNPLSYLQNATTDIYHSGFQHIGNNFFSDYYIENASFLKMDYLSLAYNFGKVGKSKISLSANASVQNVFTITNYSGLDPEVNGGVDNNSYPRPRIFMLGVNLTY